jgi:3-oxoacyl-[acyl-carrier-protein] synthase-1
VNKLYQNNEFYLSDIGICCALGSSKKEVADAAFKGNAEGMRYDTHYLQAEHGCYLGHAYGELAIIPASLKRFQSRNNQLLLTALQQIKPAIERAISIYGKTRIAVVIGSSTSGIEEGENALFYHKDHGRFPDNYPFSIQLIGDGADFLAQYLDLQNIANTISTACSSSAKAFASAAELIAMGICDAVIVGGADSLCKMTVNGFHSLSALSSERCNPFSENRSGITIGEGASLFLMQKEPSPIRLAAVGESSDAYAMTAPEPEGKGAEAAMKEALKLAGIKPDEIDYINLHGTGTLHNDAMESKAVSRIFAKEIACSSTKTLTGHTLGAAGAIEAALCWLALSDEYNPEQYYLPHIWDNQQANDVNLTGFTQIKEISRKKRNQYALSNSFAFGGSNASVILKKEV